MKRSLPAVLVLALAMAAGEARAQATASPPPPSPAPTPTPVPITVVPAAAPPAATPEPVCDPGGGDVCLTAQTQERLEKGHFRLTGFVDLRFGDSRIQCEQLDMYETEKPDGSSSRRIEAQGNVVFLRGDERLAGQRLEMDLGSGRGTFHEVVGFVQPGVFIEAREIERVDADTFRIRGGKFTSCAQPTPRWSFSASSATLDVDDKIVARNVLFKVKQVPALYVPIFAYPIQEDQRSSGLLFPHFGNSTTRGFTIGTGFFWAMGRSFDQTFYFDSYSETGFGLGHEFRYALKSPSRGGFKSYFFSDKETGWEYDLHWNAQQMLPGRVRASVQADLTSDRVFQQNFNDRLDLATNRSQFATLNLQRSFGITNMQFLGESRDTYFGDEGEFERRRRLPALLINQSPRKFRSSGLVLSYAARAESLSFGNQDLVNTYARYDILPRLSRPLSVSFLQLTPEVAARYTAYGTSDAELGSELDLTGPAVQRRYFESSADLRGPTFSRVFDTPGNFYSDRYKHVIGPEVQWTYRTRIDDLAAIPRFDGHDQITGTNQLRYSLVQRLYAKRPGMSGKPEPYEFLSWRLSQTYYVQIGASSFDPNYSSAFFDPTGAPSHWSPVQSQLIFRPSQRVATQFDFEYDTNFDLFRRLTVASSVSYPRLLFQATYSRSRRVALNPENQVLNYHTLRGSTRIVVWPNKVALDGGVDYDLLQQKLMQTTARLRYDVQCCGFQLEMVNSAYRDPPDRSFRFSVELANIGSMGNFMGGPEEREMTSILITGGAGFIGSNFARYAARAYPGWRIVVLDKLTYAGRRENLDGLTGHPGFEFVQGDIADPEVVARVLPGCAYVVNFAAETHVDRSLYDAGGFIQTDVYGTFVLLEEARRCKDLRMFVQISTDEVYGSVESGSSRETDPLMPRNPYSASKAGGDRLAYSYWATYGLPVVVTRASNNYGPHQFPEKVIPLFITHALDDTPLPLYGDGLNVRDWLHVEDHCRAVDLLLSAGVAGETYNVGGGNELPNVELTRRILALLGKPESLIRRVTDRPGHDRRYSLDCAKLGALGWAPQVLEEGLRRTVEWYRENEGWWRPIKETSPAFREHYQRHYKP